MIGDDFQPGDLVCARTSVHARVRPEFGVVNNIQLWLLGPAVGLVVCCVDRDRARNASCWVLLLSSRCELGWFYSTDLDKVAAP